MRSLGKMDRPIQGEIKLPLSPKILKKKNDQRFAYMLLNIHFILNNCSNRKPLCSIHNFQSLITNAHLAEHD